MAKRFKAQVWCSGTLLAAVLGGCAAHAPSMSPVDSTRTRAVPHGAVVQADQPMAWNQQMGGQQAGAYGQQPGSQQMGWSQPVGGQGCAAPQQLSTTQPMGSGGMAPCGGQPVNAYGQPRGNEQAGAYGGGQMSAETDKKEKEKKKEKKEGGQQAGAYGQTQPMTGQTNQQGSGAYAQQPAMGNQRGGW